MTNRHVAFGLELRTSFQLPGMALVDVCERLPALTLELATRDELDLVWSGCEAGPEWRGRLGDGFDLTIERGASGDRLFVYGDRARYLLDPDGQRLLCAPSGSSLDWQRTLIGKVIPAIAVIRGYEGLHAAVVDSPAGAIAIMAPSGGGKSTLAVELLRRGRPLFADDVLILEWADGAVRAHPGTPHMNLATEPLDGIEPRELGETLDVLAGERWLAAHNASPLPRPVRMLCLLERAPGLGLDLETLPCTPLALAPYMLGLSADPARQRERFRLYADLMQTAALVRLTAGPDHRPAQLADLIEGTLTVAQPTAAPQPGPIAQSLAGGVA